MKLGLNTYTFMWSIGFSGANPEFPDRAVRPERPLTLPDLLAATHQLGLRVMQTGPNLPMESLSPREQDRFIGQAADWGIELELGTRGLEIDHLIEQAKLARRMGATLIRTIPEIHGSYVVDPWQIEPALSPLLPVLSGEGLRLGIENGRIAAGTMRDVLDGLDPDHVGVVLDMVNSLAVPEGWKEVTRALAPHVICLHYKDFTMRRAWHMMGFLCEGAPAGKGMVETEWLFAQLRQSRHDFNVLIELWPPEQPTLAETIALEQSWLPDSVAYLRQYIPG